MKEKKFSQILKEKRFELKLNQTKMAKLLGMGLGMYSAYETGKYDESEGDIRRENYLKRLDSLGATGDSKDDKRKSPPDYFHVGKPVPYYDLDVSAGNTTIFDDRKEIPKDYLSFTPFNDCDLALNVYGDSMYPKYQSGDVIAIKEIHDFETFIQFGEVYLVVTHSKQGDNQKFIKFVRKSDKKNHYKMVSENPKHDPFDVPISDIRKMFLVKGKVELNSM